MGRDYKLYTILDEAEATGDGLAIDVRDYQHITLELSSSSSGNFTVKFQGAIGDDSPTFDSTQTATNLWDYIEVVDLEDGAAIDGDTGVAFAGTDDVRIFALNVDGLDWINARVTTYSAGKVTVRAKLYSNK